jgi:purine catabolism regulator
MRPALRNVLDAPDLHLSLVEAGGPGALERGIDWVHGSDLLDPTPFLADGQVVLTTGTQFADASEPDYSDYVQRLVRRGVRGLGFGTEVIRAGTPAELVAACRASALPLFEVPYRTPFIAVVRAVADLLDRDAHERDDWARQAQRALSLAALRPHPIDAVLSELHRQLGHPVLLVGADASVRESQAAPAPAPAAASTRSGAPVATAGARQAGARETSARGDLAHRIVARDAVGREAARLLDRGQRASSSIAVGAAGTTGTTGATGGEHATLQTIGRAGELLGVLAFTSPTSASLDRAAQSVITGVVALLGLALEHDRSRARDGVALRAALLDEALRGAPETAARLARDTGNPFPADPLVIARVRQAASETEVLLRDTTSASANGLVFASRTADGLLLCGSPARVTALAERARSRAAAVGLSRPVALSSLAEAAEHAQLACARAGSGRLVRFDDLVQNGMRSALDADRLRAVAEALIGPVREHDARFRSGLLEASRVWLEHNGQWERAAAELGMHRHTLKARIRQVEQLTSTSLDSFAARAELWLALTSSEAAPESGTGTGTGTATR